MKNLATFLFAILLFSFSLMAQNTEIINQIKNQVSKDLPLTKGTAFALDSSIYYNTYTTDWVPYNKYISTNFDNQARITQQEYYKYDNTQNLWNKQTQINMTYDNRITFGYPDPNTDIYLAYPWNSNTLNWSSDTIIYSNLTPYTFLNNPVYEDKEIFANWDFTTNQIIGGYKLDINLVQDSLYDLIIQYVFDVSSNTWIKTSKNTYTYTSNNYPQEIITFQWDATNEQWIYNEKSTYAWDANGNQIQYVNQIWDASNNVWIGSDKDTYTYDANNNKTSHIDYNWDNTNNVWKENYKREYTYDANNYKTSYTHSHWDNSINDWLKDYKYTYTYNSDGNIETEIKQNWDVTNSIWENYTKFSYTYNSHGDLEIYLTQTWDNTNSVWVNNRKDTYTYDANYNKIEYLTQNWDNTNSQWVNKHRTTYTYDSNNNNTEIIYQNWDNTNSQWVNNSKYEYYYSEHTTPVISIDKSSIANFFPNPTHDFIKVTNPEYNIKKIVITDINGKVILQNNNIQQSELLINMAKYGQGIYIIEITDEGNEIYTQKVIVY